LEKFGLIHRALAFIKYEGNNLGSMAMTLQPLLIMSLEDVASVQKYLFWACHV